MKKEELNKLKEKKAQLEKDILLMSQTINSSKLKTEEAEQLRDDKIKEAKEKGEVIKELESSIGTRTTALFCLEVDIKSKKQELSAINANIKCQELKSLEEKSNFDKLVENNRLELESKNEEVKTLNSEIISLKDSRELLDVMNKKEVVIQNDKIAILKSSELKLKNDKSDLENGIALKATESDEMEKGISILNADQTLLESNLDGFRGQINTEQKNLKELKDKVSGINKEKSILRKEADELKEELEQLKREHVSRLDLVKAMEADKEAITNEAKIVGYTPKFTKYNK